MGPTRSLAAIARAVGVSRQAIAQSAQRWSWETRTVAFDDHQALRDCPAPERLQEAAAAIPITAVASNEARQAEREFLVLVEQFRGAMEALGRDQLQAARGMTAVTRRSVAKLLEEERTLNAKDLPAFVNSAVNLASAAQHQWGKSLGVNALLDRLEGSLAAVDAEVLNVD